MRTRYYLPLVSLLCTVCLVSCKKDMPGSHHGDNSIPSAITLNANVTAGNTYRLSLSAYGNGAASIVKQAGAYSISEISYNGSAGGYVYTYTSSATPSKDGSAVKDQVILKITGSEQHSGGCHNGNNHETGSDGASDKTVTINFTVS